MQVPPHPHIGLQTVSWLHDGEILHRDSQLALRADGGGGLVLLGGEPFEEKLVMWWNFVARTGEEIARARGDWKTGDRFGEVRGYDGPPIPAPAMPATPLKPGAAPAEEAGAAPGRLAQDAPGGVVPREAGEAGKDASTASSSSVMSNAGEIPNGTP